MQQLKRRTLHIFLLAVLASVLPVAQPASAQAATFTVNASADTDDGTCNVANCTLREALNAANASAAASKTISFAAALAGSTINVGGGGSATALPTISGSAITVDGPTSGARITLKAVINDISGLSISGSANTVRGLVFQNFSGINQAGVAIRGAGATGNLVDRIYAGTGATGQAAAGAPNYIGLLLANGASNNAVQDSIFSGNLDDGVRVSQLSGTGAIFNNRLLRNKIGVDLSGNTKLRNSGNGIFLGPDASGTLISSNQISGNDDISVTDRRAGIFISNQDNVTQTITSNLIGTDSTGTTAIGNYVGIYMASSNGTVIDGNTISGNVNQGILVPSEGPLNFTISNNKIGTNSAGSAALGNSASGISISDLTGSSNITGVKITGNTISSNTNNGIRLQGDGVQGAIIQGNKIGTNSAGSAALGNGAFGIILDYACTATGPSSVQIGGDVTDAAQRNVISGNTGAGISIEGSSNNTVSGNHIGLDDAGTAILPNAKSGSNLAGVAIVTGGTISGCSVAVPLSNNNTIGGAGNLRNLIGGNGTGSNLVPGVLISTTGSGNTIRGNWIGLGNSSSLLGNLGRGITLSGADNTTIADNVIVANGISTLSGGMSIGALSGNPPLNTTISGNYIGVRPGALTTTGSGNGSIGIAFSSNAGALASTVGPNNTIAYNRLAGVQVNTGTSGVKISQSALYANNTAGSAPFANINLSGGGNGGMTSPTGLAATPTSLTGSATKTGGAACGANECTIEVFSTPLDATGAPTGESREYLTSVQTSAGGTWSATIPTTRLYRFLTATTTDNAANNTSPFASIVDPGADPTPPGLPSPALSAATQATQSADASASAVTLTYLHTLTNNGSSGQFTLNIQVAPGGTLGASVLPAGNSTIGQGQSIPVTVTVTIPRGSVAGPYTTTVRASVVGTPSTFSERQDVTNVTAQRSFAFGPASLSGTTTPGVAIDYSYRITNTGNLTESFSFTGAKVSGDPTVNTIYNGGAQPLVVGPGQSSAVPARTLVPGNASQSSATTSLTATPAAGSLGVAPSPLAVLQVTAITLQPVPGWSANVSGITPPNTPISYSLDLSNIGPASGTFSVTVSPASATGWSFALNPPAGQQFPLAIGISRTVTLVVTPTNLISDSQLVLNLTAISDAGTSASAQATTRVSRVGSFTLTPAADQFSPSIVPNGSSYAFTYTLSNQSNYTETFALAGAKVAGETNVTPTPLPGPTVTVGPSSSATVSLQVAVGGTTTQGTAQTSLTVAATSGLAPGSLTRLQTTIIQIVPQPLWGPQPLGGLATPGTPITYTATLTNVGLASGTFTVTASAPPTTSWSYQVTPALPDSSVIAVGAARPYTVVITPSGLPTEVISGTAYTLTLNAIADKGATAALPIVTTARQVARLAFSGDLARSTPPGLTLSFTNTLTNTGNGRDTFTLALPPTDAVITAISAPSQVTLEPGQSSAIVVGYTIAPGVAANGYTRAITATSAASPTLRATVTNTITVASAPGAAIQPRPAQGGNIGQTVTFTHIVTNVGNLTGPFSVTVGALPAGIQSATVTPSGNFTLNSYLTAGYTATVSVSFVISPTALAGGYSIPVSAQAGGVAASVSDVINVAFSAGVDIGPAIPATRSGLPGALLAYSYVLTNTGNGPDAFTLTVDSSLPGWSPSPTRSVSLGAGVTTTVVATVRVPAGVLAGTNATITARAQSQNDASKQDASTATATVLPQAGLTILPPAVSGLGAAGETVTYTLAVSNSGNITDSVGLSLTNSLSWTTSLTPLTISNLAPGSSVSITLAVQIPEGTPDDIFNRSTILATSVFSPVVSTTATVTTTAARPYNLLFTKDEASVAFPRDTLSYIHTLTNTGRFTDSFILTPASNLGWAVQVVPETISDLAPGESVTVTVLVTVPPRTAATRNEAPVFIPHVARVTASSVSDPQVSGAVRDTTTVSQVAALSFAPPRNARVSPGDKIVYQHKITNLGNGVDRFLLSATSNNGWTVRLSASQTPDLSPSLTGFNASPSYDIQVTVDVPANAQPGQIDTVTITAVSLYDGKVSKSVLDNSVVPLLQSVGTELRLWLPVVRR